MDAKTLIELMRDPSGDLPLVCDVAAAYAVQVAGIADRLTPEELQSMIELGKVIHRRSTRLVPVLKDDQIDDWLAQPKL